MEQAQAGDLLFFSYENKVSHVAIYLGDEQFVHAPSSGKRVSVASLRNMTRFRSSVRLLVMVSPSIP